MADDFDWDELECKALDMFRTVSSKVSPSHGTSAVAQSAQAGAELLQAMTAMRAQRLAEEKAQKNGIAPFESVTKASRPK
jgi:hypothetical protein